MAVPPVPEIQVHSHPSRASFLHDLKRENACDLARHNVTIHQEPTISIVDSVQKNTLASQRDASILPPHQHRMISVANFMKNLRFARITANQNVAGRGLGELRSHQ